MRAFNIVLLLGLLPLGGYAEGHSGILATGILMQAAKPALKHGALDTAKIHSLYMNADFEEAIDWLEAARKNGQLKTHADSVFAYKHLGVMYAAKYETMEKGKQFMYKLLTIEPTVRILDMYASDMIYMIFRNIQIEYEMQHARPGNTAVVHARPTDTAGTKPKPKISRTKTWPFWAGGIALAAGVGVTVYVLLAKVPSNGAHFTGEL